VGTAFVISAVREFANHILGRGQAAIAVPPFDGPLKPNDKLERAEIIFESPGVDDLATNGADIFLADGRSVLRLDGRKATEVRSFDEPITALACTRNGALAVALAGREVRLYPEPAAPLADAVFSSGLNAVNALAATADGTLIATDGSQARTVDQWTADLMERGRTGRVLLLDPGTRSMTVLAAGLHYAFGACATADAIVVSESWRHRILAVSRGGPTKTMLPDLPAYPSRLSPAAKGGFWLTAFVARSLLVEFVLREPGYRKRMMVEIEPRYWIAPRLRSGLSFKEPMQGAHLKTMGVSKPWAPPRSYGLVIRLSENGVPLYSLHSRVDGTHHGITAAIEVNGDLIMVAKGPGRVLRLPIDALDREFGA
jgi:hypothetical protein